MKINLYRSRKNARYNYTPRYYKGKDTGNIYSFNSKFQKYKETTNAIDFGSQWAEARSSSRNRGNREINTRVLIIFAVLVFIFLWIIGFDLTIFMTPQ